MTMQLLFAVAVLTVVHVSEGFGFGGGAAGGCGCAPPAPACAPPPPPPVCAPPPPPQICAPPPPPPVCAPPPPPVCAPPPVQNQCCAGPPPSQGPRCGCKTRRRFTQRRITRDATHEVTHMKHSTEDDPRCNSQELREIILNNISNDAEASKVAIHDTANTKLGGHYAVVCSKNSFTYIADSRVYCLDGNAALNCYAFQI